MALEGKAARQASVPEPAHCSAVSTTPANKSRETAAARLPLRRSRRGCRSRPQTAASMPTPSLLVVRESGHGAAATRSGVDDQYASRHSAWLHCPARDCRRSRRVVRGLAVRAAAASARAWAVSPGADHMAIAKPSSSPPRSRSRRRSPPTRGGRSRPAGPSAAEANVPARAGELAQYAADGVPRARSHLTAARTKERFFASQVTARGPIVAP